MSDARTSPPAADALRIGVDVREWRAGTSTGIARVVSGFLRWAARDGAHRFVLFGNQHTEFRVTGTGIDTRVVDERNRWLWDQSVLPRLLTEDDIDVLWSPYYKRPLRSPCPVVVTAHDLIELHFPRGGPARRMLLPRWMRLMLRGAAHVLTLSEYSRRDIVERLGIDPSHVSTFPPAIDEHFRQTIPADGVERVRARYGLPTAYALYVGRCTPHKNVATLVSAWRRLPAELREGVALVLAGGDVGAFEAAAARAGVSAITPGLVADADMPALYAGATLMCFPSLYEGFGLPPLEAMGCGTAVIAADAAALPEVVGNAAVLVPARDVAAWSNGLATLLSDEQARADLSARGAAHAARFTEEHCGTAILEHLVATVAGRPR